MSVCAPLFREKLGAHFSHDYDINSELTALAEGVGEKQLFLCQKFSYHKAALTASYEAYEAETARQKQAVLLAQGVKNSF
jgi:hypothetical protein